MSAPRLPEPRDIRSLADVQAWASEVHRTLQAALNDLWAQAATGYRVSNYNETRELDASTAVDPAVADVLCTLIDDLKTGKGGTILG